MLVCTLQGEVEQISMMKPKGVNPGDTGLLEYLEDIIGTDKYVEKIEQLGKRCAALLGQLRSPSLKFSICLHCKGACASKIAS